MAKVNCIETLKTSSYVLSKTGILFNEHLRELDIVKIILNILFDIVINFLIVLNIKNSVEMNNIRLTNWMICLLLPMENYVAKRLTLLVNKKCVLCLLQIVDTEPFNNHNKKLNRHIEHLNTMSRRIFKYFAFTMTVSLTIFCILPFVIDIKMMIPYPFESKRFEVAYKLLHFMSAFYLSINTTCLDIFYITLLGLGIAQLTILEERLIYILEDAEEIKKISENGIYSYIGGTLESILRECIILHKMIIEFVKNLTILLSFPLFVQYTCGCLIICNTILQITIMGETKTAHLVGICAYSSVIVVEMAAYHWWANEIIFKSDKLVESCYLSKWYELNVSCQKSLILLMKRAQKPLVVKLYSFVDISLYSLGVVIRWSYSVFALIKANYS